MKTLTESKATPAQLTLLDAMKDPVIFGPWFESKTWRAWRVFFLCAVRSAHGTTFTGDLPATHGKDFATTTTKQGSVARRWQTWGQEQMRCIGGRLSGLFQGLQSTRSAPGERGTVMVIAADRKQARVIFRYIVGFLEAVPLLGQMMMKQTQGHHLSQQLGQHRSPHRELSSSRGYTIIAALCDEIAFWTGEESQIQTLRY